MAQAAAMLAFKSLDGYPPKLLNANIAAA